MTDTSTLASLAHNAQSVKADECCLGQCIWWPETGSRCITPANKYDQLCGVHRYKVRSWGAAAKLITLVRSQLQTLAAEGPQQSARSLTTRKQFKPLAAKASFLLYDLRQRRKVITIIALTANTLAERPMTIEHLKETCKATKFNPCIFDAPEDWTIRAGLHAVNYERKPWEPLAPV